MRSPATVPIRSAGEIITEIGTDVSVFPSAGHLLSWARIVLRLDESAHRREDLNNTKSTQRACQLEPTYWSSHTSLRSWRMYWLGEKSQFLIFLWLTMMR